MRPFYGAERHDEQLVKRGPPGENHDLYMCWIVGSGWRWWYGSKGSNWIVVTRDGGKVGARRDDVDEARRLILGAAQREERASIRELERKLRWHGKILGALEAA